MKITIFTPTYNRAYIIKNLYDSLQNQTAKDFEWLIVDDGSTDNTEELIRSFIHEKKIDIRYIKQENGGKHRAINRGVKEAKGELFFIVDSDDFLEKNAVERLFFHYSNIKDNASFAGLCGVKAYSNGEVVGNNVNFEILDCNSLDFRYKHNVSGDMAEVYITEILRQYPFPEIVGEKFCPEALVWNRVALKYKLRYFNEKIYFCDYLADGLTAKIVKIRMNSPEASKIYYSELYAQSIPFIQKLKTVINYWRFACCSQVPFIKKVKQIGAFSLFVYPLGLIFHLKDLRS